MATLYLGSCDKRRRPTNPKEFLKPYHIDGLLLDKVTFRDDDRTKWRSFREGTDDAVENLQRFLFKAGFMPRAAFDGVFGYVTQAAVRLFQEYVRTMENFKTMVPDGIVGSGTMSHVDRWKNENKVSEWGSFTGENPTEAYTNWMQLLHKAKDHYTNNPGPILKHLNGLRKTYASIKPADWKFDTNDIHLIGIRRKQTESAVRRENDDLFILLINGMAFTFWGSTDASVNMAGRKHEAFLIEGQHRYRFGWHKISVEQKIYRALKPLDSRGVMIIRDWDDDNAYTDKDIKVKDRNGNLKGMLVNPSINIHWTGIGHSNFSAGCQVIAGKSYLNHKNELQDCSKFASTSYGGLTTSNKRTKGAYNVFTDLVLCYAPDKVTDLHYTLGRETSLEWSENFGAQYASDTLKRLKSV
ncbi:peptidoglycan-binding domain-containing protein [Winogradskyella bathintestinalis]|uniref:Peptidoglycan-binding domain-containing protein n=1 Tax=Winogradskyella bathintestinalis TaxID=3035208 RepID=A0ABT7ZX38_9FLAO|nr:peptidoglycan-binding domain-containing protein [Winogradskyella bathintestinalis]MDN3493544.1 peptidoglycan-binding domain-containing protein [Winogradskyella bathintestinalis]